MSMFLDKDFLKFAIKLLLYFLILYYGTLLVIGLSEPAGYYSPFVDDYLNYIALMRKALMGGTRILLSIFGIDTYYASEFVIRKVNGTGIRMVYQCIGYAVMSFWVALVCATSGLLRKKIYWLLLGLVLLYLINITRLALVLVAGNNKWQFPFGWDHHTWFNIISYAAIFLMMYFFDHQLKDEKKYSDQ